VAIDVPAHIWKVIIVMDKPGQTIANMAFEIDLPNKNPANDLILDRNGNLVNPTRDPSFSL
jgi:DNA/RNA endonuclease G (NUC1)